MGFLARIRPLITLGLLLSLAAPLSACDKPCERLEKKVCLEMKDKARCKLLQEPDRKENLPAAACEGLLEHLAKR